MTGAATFVNRKKGQRTNKKKGKKKKKNSRLFLLVFCLVTCHLVRVLTA